MTKEGRLLQVPHGVVVFQIAYEPRREALQGELVDPSAQKETVVGEDRQKIPQYAVVLLDDLQDAFAPHDPEPAVAVGDDRHRVAVLRPEDERRGERVGRREGVERQFTPLGAGHLGVDASLAQQEQRAADAVLQGDEIPLPVRGVTPRGFLQNGFHKVPVAAFEEGHVVNFTFHTGLNCRSEFRRNLCYGKALCEALLLQPVSDDPLSALCGRVPVRMF